MLAAIVRRARALLGRDIAYLCLNDDDRGDTYMRVTDGSVSAEFQAVRLPLGAGLGGLVAQQGVPIASADYFRDDRFPHTTTIDSAVRAEGLVSILGVPLKRGSQVIGVLFAADRRRTCLLPGRGRAAVLAGRACRGGAGQRPAAGRDPGRADRSRACQRRAARSEPGHRTGRARARSAGRTGAARRRGGRGCRRTCRSCWAGRSSCRLPAQADEPIGPGQSSVPVVAGSEVLGRLVLTRDGAPRPADLRVLERGAVVTALLLLFNRHLAEVANRGRRDLLEDLLTGSVTDDGRDRRQSERISMST